MFYFDKINGKKILRNDKIENSFFTTKESFIKTKDETLKETVKKNKKDILDYLRVEKIIMPCQKHTGNVEIVSAEEDNYEETDALILQDKNIAIALNFADCLPLILYDEYENIGAIAHCGWRGTVQKIAQKTAKKMLLLGCKRENIKALIGPCISKCCFETNLDVGYKLYQTIGYDITNIKSDKCYPDLKEINKTQLQNIGINDIEVTSYCTVCNNDLFFSYRLENATTNRHSAILKLD